MKDTQITRLEISFKHHTKNVVLRPHITYNYSSKSEYILADSDTYILDLEATPKEVNTISFGAKVLSFNPEYNAEFDPTHPLLQKSCCTIYIKFVDSQQEYAYEIYKPDINIVGEILNHFVLYQQDNTWFLTIF